MKNKTIKVIVVTHNGQNQCTWLLTPKAYKAWTLSLSTGDYHCHKHYELNLDQPNASILDVSDLEEMGWV